MGVYRTCGAAIDAARRELAADGGGELVVYDRCGRVIWRAEVPADEIGDLARSERADPGAH